MRFIRVHISSRKTVIYHPSFGDIWKRLCCMFGVHEYEIVLEYPSAGAKEEMCVHCLKERYSVDLQAAAAYKASSTA
ncbi:MAG: hypothetical protein KF749_03225 [Bacteroidetes bacterium]|nr:hypothetical protein [Bacteroidota bacterium]MCW5895502.1 hypothetical protein [Bacteroidota bacterium]